MAVPTSSPPKTTNNDIHKEATLPNHDPPPDSPTAALVSSHQRHMVATYVRPPPMMAKGEGCYLWDVENRRYLDFSGGIAVNALGHCDSEVAKILYQQAQTLMHTSNLYHNPWTGALCTLLVEKTREGGGMSGASRAFISNSGAEANEAALKFCRKVGHGEEKDGSKHELVTFKQSFHGRTLGSLSVTPNAKYQAPFAPLLPGCKVGTYNDTAGLEGLISSRTCGVIVEPIQGEGGVNVASPSFLRALRRRCDEVGALLVYDEIQCGMSRTGQLWAHGGEWGKGAHPDILTTAKALGNGYPIGATLVTEAVAQRVVTGDHGTTFGGNPLACRVAHHVLGRLTEDGMLEGVKRKEQVFRQRFERLRQLFPETVEEVRGRGLILGVQLTGDPTGIVTAARERGLLVITCGTNTLRFVPPLVVTEGEIEEGMDILERAMAAVILEEGKGREGGVKETNGQQEMAPSGR